MSGGNDIPRVGDLDEVIHGRLRLGVMAYLAGQGTASFPDLGARLEATNGNLSTHLTKLEGAGYIRQEKGYNGKRPQTLVHITPEGREAWIAYLETMRGLLGEG